jgi:hypothetical protein
MDLLPGYLRVIGSATHTWTTLTNVPAVVDFQNAITDPIVDGARFFRLKK